MRQDIDICTFTKGEGSPKLKGRTDYAGYYEMAETELNFVTLPQGGATRRPGTMLGALARDQTNAVFRERLLDFVFSTVQAYMLEFGSGFIRVYKNDGPVLNAGVPVDIIGYNSLGTPLAVTGAANNGSGVIRLALTSTASLSSGQNTIVGGVAGTTEANGNWLVAVIDGTHVDLQGSTFTNAYTAGGVLTPLALMALPYQVADLPNIQYTQSADTLYLCHPLYPTIVLTRSSHISWTATQVQFLDGPYLGVNGAATTITPSGTTGLITLTANSTIGINATPQNPGQGFLASDVGRAIRIKVSAKWGWAVITARSSALVASAVVMPAVAAPTTGNYVDGVLDGTAATANWQLGKWSATTGYPYVPMFWQNRLVLCGTNNQPNAVEASTTGNFPGFSPTMNDGTVIATCALSWIISDNRVNAMRWLSPAGSAASMQFGIGTSGGEQILTQANTSAALSPTNMQIYPETSYGSAPGVRPVRIGKALLFADKTGRKLREWQWTWTANGYLGPELTADAEHITRPTPFALQGIIQLAYQQAPHGILWALRGDGQLIGLTYLPEQKVVAWHRHQLGGQYYGGPPFVESIATIPSPDGTYDELWLTVLRTVAGLATRTVEVMTRFFDGMPQDQAWFVDCAIQSALTFPSATLTPGALSGSGVTFLASSGVFASGDVAAGTLIRVNNGLAIVRSYTDPQHVVGEWYVPATSIAPAAANAWSYTAQSASFSGLSYLNGETVQIIGDGADFGTQAVSAGGVTLPQGGRAALATAGLPMPSNLVTMPFAPRQAVQSIAGKEKRIDHIFLRLHESLGCRFGQKRTDPMTGVIDHPGETLETRGGNNVLGQAPPLQSGIYKVPLPGGFDREGQIEIGTSGPFPLTVLSIGAACDVSGAASP